MCLIDIYCEFIGDKPDSDFIQFRRVLSVAYLGLHFGGGSKFIWKIGAFAWREAPCSAFARGVREKIFKNGAIWCVLGSILLKFCQKNNLKNSHFLYKNNR